MRRLFSSFFTHVHKERVAVFYLLLFLISISTAYYYMLLHPSAPAFKVMALVDSTAQVNRITQKTEVHTSNSTSTFSSSIFDPNHISMESLIGLGVPKKAAHNWAKYLERGGRFKSAADLSKIYGLPDKTIDRLKPLLDFQNHIKDPRIEAPGIVDRPPDTYKIDPNTALLDQWIYIGVPQKTAQTIRNYSIKGGRFYSTQDLAKIYGMNDSLISNIAAYLEFPETLKSIPAAPSPININTADTSQWKRLTGIGSTLARRIVSYREKLGGFYTPAQLKEVYGLPDTTLEKIQTLLIPSPIFRRIRINVDTLSKQYHPYLSKKDALSIENYRLQHGPFKDGQDLMGMLAFDKSFWDRLVPYLDFSLPVKNTKY